MSWLNDVFGSGTEKKKREDAERATAEANQKLEAGKTLARTELQGGVAGQMSALAGGYGTARDDLTRGMTEADNRLVGGYGQARTDVNAGFDAATDRLDPWIASGRTSLGQLDSAIGNNGADAQRTYYEQYADANNPLTSYRDEQANKQLQQQFNARGQSASGRFDTAVGRASLERRNADVQANLDRITRQSELGGQFADRAAGYDASRGTTLGNLSAQEGQARGDLAYRGNAALGDVGYRYGADQASVTGSNANALANLEYGNAQQVAGNAINLGSAKAASRNNNGFQNIMGAVGTGISAFTPNRYGQSAFNMLKPTGETMNRLWG